MEEQINNLAAHTLGQIAESDTLRGATAGKLKASLGRLHKAGVSAAMFGTMAMALSLAPTAAHADGIGGLLGAGAGAGLGSLVGHGLGKVAAMVGGAGAGAYVGNKLTGDGGAAAQRHVQQEMRGADSPNAVGPQFPPNDTPVASSNVLARVVGGAAGGIIGGLVGSRLGGGTGKTVMEIAGAGGGVYAGQSLGNRIAGSHPVEPGHATMVQIPGHEPVAAAPAPWGQLSPFMAQIEGYSQPVMTLDANPRAKQALDRALEQLESERAVMINAGQTIGTTANNQEYAVTAEEHRQVNQARSGADRAFTDAQHVFLGLGVMTAKSMLDNFAMEGYDLRAYAPRVLADLDVPMPTNLRLKHASVYDASLTHIGVEGARDGQVQQANASDLSGSVPNPAQARAAQQARTQDRYSANTNLGVADVFKKFSQ